MTRSPRAAGEGHASDESTTSVWRQEAGALGISRRLAAVTVLGLVGCCGILLVPVEALALGLASWTTAWTYGTIFAASLLRRRLARRSEVAAYLVALPVAMLATGGLAWLQLGGGLGGGFGADPMPPTPERAWLIARLLIASTFATTLAVTWWQAGRPRPPAPRGAWITLALLVLAALAAPLVALPTAALHLAAAPLFFVFGGVLLPALRRGRRDALGAGFIASTAPQIACQIALAAGVVELAAAFQLFAALMVAAGAAADDASAWSDRRVAVAERADAERALRHRTAELERAEVERLSQERLHRQAERLRQMLHKAMEVTSLGVTVTDMDGKILYVNPADARMHGYEVEELLGQDVRIYAADTEEGAMPITTTPEPWARERLNRHRSGEAFPVRLVSDRVNDEDGRPIATVTLCEDIRDRLRIREAIERRDRILEAVAFAAETFLAESRWQEGVGEVLARLGRATRVRRVELVLSADGVFGEQLLRYRWSCTEAGDERLETPDDQVSTASSDQPMLPSEWRSALERGEAIYGSLDDTDVALAASLGPDAGSWAIVPVFVQSGFRGRLALEDRDAERRWSVAELESLRTASRTVGASIQRHEDEEALAASEAKHRDLLENAHDLIQSVSPDGRFQFVNRAWMQTLGFDDTEVPDLKIWDIIKPPPGEEPRDVLQDMLTAESRGREEAVFVAKDGREIAVEGVVTRRFVDGLPVAVQGIFRDITERKAVDRLKQEFISTVSHELRTPLTSIIASLALVDSGRLDSQPERAAELVSVAHRNGGRLLKLINNLLDLQKLAARKMTFRKEPLDVATLLEEAADSLGAVAAERKVSIEVRPLAKSMRVIGDHDRLMQVLHNLVSNAVKFSAANDVVELSASRRGQRVMLAVRDEGPGIPEEFRARLFEQFTQADPSKTRTSGGSGLGLSIVKGLVEGMDGTVDVVTEVGSGTTFMVDLPRADATMLTFDEIRSMRRTRGARGPR
ncbi:MAG: PAS domain S-box protein [Acidobacteriota bacterium]